MLSRMALVAVLAMTIGHPALSQDQPPSSAEAKRIEALVNKAAAIVDAKGKAALSEFREKGSEWFSSEAVCVRIRARWHRLAQSSFPCA